MLDTESSGQVSFARISRQSCHKDFVGTTLGRRTEPIYSLTMPFDARNAVFNGDYNDYGSNFYLVQGNDRTEGTDISHLQRLVTISHTSRSCASQLTICLYTTTPYQSEVYGSADLP